jgi:hypothetical protein
MLRQFQQSLKQSLEPSKSKAVAAPALHPVIAVETPARPKCPRCGSDMVLRRAKNGLYDDWLAPVYGARCKPRRLNRAPTELILMCKLRHDRQPAENFGCLRVHLGDVAKDERRKVRVQLERYCGQDTEGMIWIVDAISRLAS